MCEAAVGIGLPLYEKSGNLFKLGNAKMVGKSQVKQKVRGGYGHRIWGFVLSGKL